MKHVGKTMLNNARNGFIYNPIHPFPWKFHLYLLLKPIAPFQLLLFFSFLGLKAPPVMNASYLKVREGARPLEKRVLADQVLCKESS